MGNPKRSPEQLGNVIKTAVSPNWGGTGGLEDMLTNLLDLIRHRQLITVNDIGTLASLSGADGLNVIVRGVGIFKFNPNNSGTHPDSSIQGISGVWDLFGVVHAAPYRKLVGDSVSTTFTVKHNLNNLYPTVSVFAYETPGSTNPPYSQVSDYQATIIDANTITITQSGNQPWGGNSHLVVVKP